MTNPDAAAMLKRLVTHFETLGHGAANGWTHLRTVHDRAVRVEEILAALAVAVAAVDA